MIARRLLPLILILLLAVAALGWGADHQPHKPGARDKCAVCGMFVASYVNFAGQIQFKDGRTYYFDGSKDLFRFYNDIPHYAPGNSVASVAAVYVTSYYDVALVDGTKAWFVSGSDVNGPMGTELIAFAKESDAKEFAKDHHGKKIYRFKEVTPAVLKGLD